MVVEFISVGTEILLGNIVNTNAQFLSQECAALGLSCYYQTVVGDNEERLTETFKTAWKRSDFVILTGGLGPTEDDLTKEVVAKALRKTLVEDAVAKTMIQEYFQKRNIPISDNNWKQAMVIKDSVVLYNDNGTAPGMIVESGEKTAILLPGPPLENIPMFKKYLVEYFESKNSNVIRSVTVKLCGIGESLAEEMIKDLIDSQTNPTIATYAKTGEVHIRVTASGESEKQALKIMKPVIKELKTRFGVNVYSTDEDVTLEKAVVDLLLANHLTVSTVESCTGGLLAGRLINVPGVSEVFKIGHITYSNKAKRKTLGIKKRVIEQYSAVSEEVALEMVRGSEFLTKADVIVSVTGLAGPDGGTEEKPVGLVYIGCSVKGKVVIEEYHFKGNREKIRQSAVSAALVLMRKCILDYYSHETFHK